MSYVFDLTKIIADLQDSKASDDAGRVGAVCAAFRTHLTDVMRQLHEETIRLHSDTETVLFRLRLDGMTAEFADLRTGAWYQTQTRVGVFQELLAVAEKASNPRAIVGEIVRRMEQRFGVLNEGIATLHAELTSVKGKLRWGGMLEEFGDIHTGGVYATSTEMAALRDAWQMVRAVLANVEPAPVVSIRDLIDEGKRVKIMG